MVDHFLRVFPGVGLISWSPHTSLLEAELDLKGPGQFTDLGDLVEIESKDKELQDYSWKAGPFLPFDSFEDINVLQYLCKITPNTVDFVGLLSSPIKGDDDLFQAALYKLIRGLLVKQVQVRTNDRHEPGAFRIGNHFRKLLVHQGLTPDTQMCDDRIVPEFVNHPAKCLHAHNALGPSLHSLPEIAQGAPECAHASNIEKQRIRHTAQLHFTRSEFQLIPHNIAQAFYGPAPWENKPG